VATVTPSACPQAPGVNDHVSLPVHLSSSAATLPLACQPAFACLGSRRPRRPPSPSLLSTSPSSSPSSSRRLPRWWSEPLALLVLLLRRVPGCRRLPYRANPTSSIQSTTLIRRIHLPYSYLPCLPIAGLTTYVQALTPALCAVEPAVASALLPPSSVRTSLGPALPSYLLGPLRVRIRPASAAKAPST